MKADIVITEITKSFRTGLLGKKTGVSELSLNVPAGEVIGLLGPNGSGKSTTIKLIMNFLRPDKGEITICGANSRSREARRFIGYLPENPRFQKFLTGNDLLKYYGRLLGLGGIELGKRCAGLLELVNLSLAGDEKVAGYSKGMTQRLAIAQALIHRPPILILDEPMSGLDPIGRIDIRHLIRRIHDEMPESTIFFSSHVLSDVEELCSSVALLRKGKLIAFSPILDLVGKHELRYELILKGQVPSTLDPWVTESKQSPLGSILTVEGTAKLLSLLDTLKQYGAQVVAIQSARRKLEEALFSGTGDFT